MTKLIEDATADLPSPGEGEATTMSTELGRS